MRVRIDIEGVKSREQLVHPVDDAMLILLALVRVNDDLILFSTAVEAFSFLFNPSFMKRHVPEEEKKRLKIWLKGVGCRPKIQGLFRIAIDELAHRNGLDLSKNPECQRATIVPTADTPSLENIPDWYRFEAELATVAAMRAKASRFYR